MGRNVTFRGVLYKSYSSLSKEYGLSRGLLSARLKRGYTLEEAISTVVVRREREVVYGGVTYKSYSMLAEKYDIPRNTLYRRLRRGYSLEDAMRLKVTSYQVPSVIEFRGVPYTTIGALADAYGVSKQAVHYRLRTGSSLEAALGFDCTDV